MAEHSTIEWTDATWNPVTGCAVVSPGCTNCYAMKLAGTRLKHHPSRKGLTVDTKAGPVWNGKVRLNHEWLTQPLTWKRPRMIFVCAHGDLFHEDVPDDFIDKVFAVMALAPQHTFQVLTKRADRMREYLACIEANPPRRTRIMAIASRMMRPNDPRKREGAPYFPLPNVWLGVSVEDQKRADERIPHLLATPAAKRFISAEPLLGPVDLMSSLGGTLWIGGQRGCSGSHHGIGTPDCPRERHHHHDERCRDGLDWVIVGGESGNGARPMHPDWARSLRDQCAAANVPFLFKQWGAWACAPEIEDAGGDSFHKFSDGTWMQNYGKKAAGRLLDGVEHNGMPT